MILNADWPVSMLLLLFTFQTQFLLCIVHCSQLFFMKDCEYPMIFCYWIFLYAFIFIVLFSNFYIQTYRKRRQQQKKQVHSNGDKKRS